MSGDALTLAWAALLIAGVFEWVGRLGSSWGGRRLENGLAGSCFPSRA